MTAKSTTATEAKRPWWRTVFEFVEAMEDGASDLTWEHISFLRKRTDELESRLQKLESDIGNSSRAA